MIAAVLAAAVACGTPGQPLCRDNVGGAVLVYGSGGSGGRPYSIPGVVGPILGAEVEVCSGDPNRPDLTVCISGAKRRIKLFMPYPPCGTPEAKAARRCVEWKIGRPW